MEGGRRAVSYTHLDVYKRQLPQLTSKISSGAKVYNNVVEDNNIANFAPEGATARIVPPGSGILLIGADDNEVYGNTIRNNKTARCV